ncbi:MAG: YsnF/AvaK domain-containing protein [Cytophagaceae bacterium]
MFLIKKEKMPENNSITNNEIITIPVIEEDLKITIKEEKIPVKIEKNVISETFDIDIPLNNEEVSVERIPVNKEVEGEIPRVKTEGDKIVIPVLKEVIIKKTIITEEIHITKKNVQDHVHKKVTLKKEILDVEYNINNDKA